MASPILPAVAGAAPGSGPDEPVAAHYGEPLREQRSFEDGAAVVDLGHRDVLAVVGPDRLGWLHSLTTQHLDGLPPSTGTETLVLSPHGHVEHAARLADDGTRTVLDVEPGTAEALRTFLERMRFLLRVEVTAAPLHVLALVGPRADEVLASAGLPVPPEDTPLVGVDGAAPVPVAVADGLWVRRRRWPAPAPGVDLLVPVERALAVWTALTDGGAAPAGLLAWEAVRVAAREPRLGPDTDDRTLPHELGWLGAAVHLQKGCYRGQETVARVHNLGRPPRRLVLLHLDGTEVDLPEPGAPVEVEGGTRPVGRLGSVARHHELGPVALALVKRSSSLDAPLRVGGLAAAVDPDDVVAPDDERRERPRLARLGR